MNRSGITLILGIYWNQATLTGTYYAEESEHIRKATIQYEIQTIYIFIVLHITGRGIQLTLFNGFSYRIRYGIMNINQFNGNMGVLPR